MTITVSVESFPLQLVIQNPKTGRTVQTVLGVTKDGEVIADGDGGVRSVNSVAFREKNVARGKN